MAENQDSIADNFRRVRAEIAKACILSGRAETAAQLIAVSKTKPIDILQEALDAGQRVFGENRVQEAAAKFPELRKDYDDIQLHLIGPLQSNKAKEAVALFDVIQTLDRPKIVSALARAEQEQGRKLDYYIQVNTGEEPQKAGVAPDAVADCLNQAVAAGLNVVGLMCIPPAEDPAAPHFAFLKRIADALGLSEVSMGMSADYAIAAELGATQVRVGSALFGGRPPLSA